MRFFLKTIFLGFVIGMVMGISTQIMAYIELGHFDTLQRILEILRYQMLYGITLCVVNAHWFKMVNTKIDWRRYSKYRFVLSLLGSIVITLISIFYIRMYHEMVWGGESYREFTSGEGIKPYLFSVGITLVIGLIFYGIYFYRESQKNKVKEQSIIAGTASARFDALKNQLDPHFLFNSLNVLTSLIEENPTKAQKFTTALSKVYRYVLEQKNKDLVTVEEELNFARSYMSLLKMRFEDSIIFDIPLVSINPDKKVVPLSLQLLLENAVKHNVVTNTKPLHIKIYERGDDLVIENNRQPKQIIKKSTGVGLTNIRQRYDLLTNRKVTINQDNNRFIVAIPMLQNQMSIMKPIQPSFNDSYVRARKHVEELKEFYYGLMSYVVVIPFLIFVNYNTYWGFQWFWFPLFGWGIGLIFHAYKLYVADGIFGRNWEKKKIEKFIRDEEQKARY